MSHVMNTYTRLPVAFERGEGLGVEIDPIYLEDIANRAECDVQSAE